MITEKILIAESDPRAREVLVIKLSNAGYHVHSASQGDEVLEKALSLQPDLIILTINLPVKDGFEICYELRQTPQTRRIPIIAVLDEDRDLNDLAGIGVKFEDKLIKPFPPKDALMKAHLLLAQKRSLMGVNTLTGLPGKQQFDMEVKDRLELGAFFNLLFIDVEGFTVYNKYYGFEQGDEIIKAVGDLLNEVVDGLDTADVFLAHTGGDNFRMILPVGYGERVGKEIIARFDQRIPQYYLEHDRNRGGIVVKNRQGILEQYPIMTVAVAQVSNEFRSFGHPLETELIGDELLRYARNMPGSNFVFDRRRNDDERTAHRVDEA